MKSITVLSLFFSLNALALPGANTDLGVDGNSRVAKAFSRYVANSSGCTLSGESNRVLLSGFGPFAGTSRNISGQVSVAMADASFWPEDIELDQSSPSPQSLSSLPKTKNGAWTTQRTLSIDGVVIEVCFVYLDVIWDLASAILVHEAQSFQPTLILLTGLGGNEAIFEGGALNQALGYPGFDASGMPMKFLNHPWCQTRYCDYWENTFVLPPTDSGVQKEIGFGWDNRYLRSQAQSLIERALPGVSVQAPSRARQNNNYICNNTSYVVSHAAKQTHLRLAGGKIKLEPTFDRAPTVGFFHYPDPGSVTASNVFAWAKVMARVMERGLFR